MKKKIFVYSKILVRNFQEIYNNRKIEFRLKKSKSNKYKDGGVESLARLKLRETSE